eukprot:4336082-Prymnesium_polylepis.1
MCIRDRGDGGICAIARCVVVAQFSPFSVHPHRVVCQSAMRWWTDELFNAIAILRCGYHALSCSCLRYSVYRVYSRTERTRCSHNVANPVASGTIV